jgi:hypothetical protein
MFRDARGLLPTDVFGCAPDSESKKAVPRPIHLPPFVHLRRTLGKQSAAPYVGIAFLPPCLLHRFLMYSTGLEIGVSR